MGDEITRGDSERTDEERERDEGEQQDESVQSPWPTLYVDGEIRFTNEDEFDRVQVEFDDVANGMLNDEQLKGPLAWCNSAAITLDREDDAVHVSISCGDPRGAFVMTIRRIEGNLLMHVPHPGDSLLHEPLAEHHAGTYKVGYWPKETAEDG